MSESSRKQALREDYVSFIEQSGKSKNTANTTAAELFALWNNCGEEYFWSVIRADNDSLREMITKFLETYYPRQLKWKSGYMTSVRYFREYLAAKGDSEPLPVVSYKAVRKTSYARKSQHEVLTLTNEMLEQEHQNVLADPGYGSDYRLIDSILKRFPENTDPELVALKIALFDMTYSTNIGRHRQKIVLEELAGIIVGIKDLDERIRQGDPSVVPIIARSNGRINLFSFATKYCTNHAVCVYGNDDYVIFDRVVKDALPKYVSWLHKTTIEQWRSTCNYTAYKECIDELLDANGIDIPFRRRKLDHYLWHTYRKPTEEETEE